MVLAGGRPLGSLYVLVAPIGRGAMGTVWRARTRGTHEPVAVKVLREELATEPEIVARFVQERNVLLRLDHPRLVRLRDLVAEGEVLALVMDLVEGSDLRQHLRSRGSLTPPSALRSVAALAEGLAAVHDAGIVHRDLKPANILLDDPDDPTRVRITDFGVARVLGGPALTACATVVGTPDYLAPEVVQGASPTAAADVYAAGVVLYELLSGRPPFRGDHPMTVLHRQIAESPVRPPRIPERVWDEISACLAKEPEGRPSAAALADRLGRLADAFEGGAARAASGMPPPAPESPVPGPRASGVPVSGPPASGSPMPGSPTSGDPVSGDPGPTVPADDVPQVEAPTPYVQPADAPTARAHAADVPALGVPGMRAAPLGRKRGRAAVSAWHRCRSGLARLAAGMVCVAVAVAVLDAVGWSSGNVVVGLGSVRQGNAPAGAIGFAASPIAASPTSSASPTATTTVLPVPASPLVPGALLSVPSAAAPTDVIAGFTDGSASCLPRTSRAADVNVVVQPCVASADGTVMVYALVSGPAGSLYDVTIGLIRDDGQQPAPPGGPAPAPTTAPQPSPSPQPVPPGSTQPKPGPPTASATPTPSATPSPTTAQPTPTASRGGAAPAPASLDDVEVVVGGAQCQSVTLEGPNQDVECGPARFAPAHGHRYEVYVTWQPSGSSSSGTGGGTRTGPAFDW